MESTKLSMRGRRWMIGVAAAGTLAGLMGMTPPGFSPFYRDTVLVSDEAGEAPHRDTNLVNGWGIAASPRGPWWVSAAETGKSTLYDGAGTPLQLVVSIPGPAGSTGNGTPTGIVFNPTDQFVVRSGNASGPAVFIFATEEGAIAAWAPNVPPPAPSAQAQLVVDNSKLGARYTGLAIGADGFGNPRLFAADFGSGTVDIFNGRFQAVNPRTHPFRDINLPRGYAPFGIQNINGSIFVTYAQRNDDGDEVRGAGLGIVDEYDGDGRFQRRFATGGTLNAPWGVAWAPDGFGPFGGAILIGNFGDGRINAYARNGRFLGQLMADANTPIEIDGLWGIGFGNGHGAGPATTLYYAAGPDDETHGYFGKIEALGRH